ncbi:hypothetical protein SAMN05421839_1189 [Halolactibacillus halophilus]|uniref:Uncharacterized protein n=1 Tax=Halolactibacillus halophilus TaxID=306540 RepID=A0A1I5Q0W7_9BACI|nr:hypothetical protein [Halolactibacillus halophilus]GEM01932.1 hypothetical protein HHA03_14640 [Halolactibacillus halophilus]SFP39845.1 hypothetical protein SAMN05421839_1189 [Halolactibacillus halophilus]
MNVNSFRVKLFRSTDAEQLTNDVNDYLHICDREGTDILDVTYQPYRASGGATIHTYTVKHAAYTREEVEQYHKRN